LYLDVAEGDELKLVDAPPLTVKLYERYLPAALALEVEQHWAERFAAVFATQAAAQSPSWYSGDAWDSRDVARFHVRLRLVVQRRDQLGVDATRLELGQRRRRFVRRRRGWPAEVAAGDAFSRAIQTPPGTPTVLAEPVAEADARQRMRQIRRVSVAPSVNPTSNCTSSPSCRSELAGPRACP